MNMIFSIFAVIVLVSIDVFSGLYYGLAWAIVISIFTSPFVCWQVGIIVEIKKIAKTSTELKTRAEASKESYKKKCYLDDKNYVVKNINRRIQLGEDSIIFDSILHPDIVKLLEEQAYSVRVEHYCGSFCDYERTEVSWD